MSTTAPHVYGWRSPTPRGVGGAAIAAGAAAEQRLDSSVPPAVLQLRQPVAGRVLALSEVPDAMFTQGTMGPGLAIDPTGDTIVAPAGGTIASVFPTGHAIGLALADGTELLIHVGIDTVDMKGDGFETLVTAGDTVEAGTPLLRFDAEKIRRAGHPAITPVIVLNNEDATIEFA